MTTAQFATETGLSPVSVGVYIRRGLITATKEGRDYNITEAELERFQRERQIGGGRPRKKYAVSEGERLTGEQVMYTGKGR